MSFISTFPSIISSLIHISQGPVSTFKKVNLDISKNGKGVATASLREKATVC
jgi:hypothetical protein